MARMISTSQPVERSATDRSRAALAEVEALAWLLDNSIPVPGTGGRRFGVDAIISLVPWVGDVVSGAIGLYLVWRASRFGLPGIVVARMLANVAIDAVVGIVPFLGDAFDFWFKASTRNLRLMRRHLETPGASTREDWLYVGAIIVAIALILAALGWLIASVIGAVVGLFS